MRRLFTLFLTACVAASTLGAAHAADEAGKSEAPVIAVFSLNGVFVEKPPAEDLPFDLTGGSQQTLRPLLNRMRKAKDDDNVKAIMLMSSGVSIGYAQMQELQAVIQELKDAGKKIYAHATEISSTKRYALLASADELSMVPTGYLFITGLYGEQMFLRGLLNKIGVEPDYFTCGDYKSAAEMFMRTEPSPEAAEMTKWLYDGIYANLLKVIADGRGVPVKKVSKWIDEGVFTAENAVKIGVIDKVMHRQDLEAQLKKTYGKNVVFERRYGRPKQPTIDFSSPFGVLSFYGELLKPPKKVDTSKPAVGIVYLEGPILPGSGGGSPFMSGGIAFSGELRKALEEVANDDSIKAVVLRVNSPGGSAVASEVILDATRRVKAKKPFVVSMGDVAGSGGYYVACAADTIFADPATITGSIGVVSGKFATTKMWDKVGINWSPVARGKNSGLLSSASKFSESEKAEMQGYMDEVYGVFKGHVLAIRGDRLKKDIDELAGGRVYTGQQALELGLVDKLGSLDDAIKFIAKEAKLDDYGVRIVPRSKNFLEILMADLTGGNNDPSKLLLPFAKSEGSVIDLALPYLKGLDPQRTKLVMQALLQMQLLGEERVILTMPLMYFGD